MINDSVSSLSAQNTLKYPQYITDRGYHRSLSVAASKHGIRLSSCTHHPSATSNRVSTSLVARANAALNTHSHHTLALLTRHRSTRWSKGTLHLYHAIQIKRSRCNPSKSLIVAFAKQQSRAWSESCAIPTLKEWNIKSPYITHGIHHARKTAQFI